MKFDYKKPRHLALACFALGILFGAFNLQAPCFIFVIIALILWTYHALTQKGKTSKRKPAPANPRKKPAATKKPATKKQRSKTK